MLLAQGSVVYYGAANKAVDYFDSIGYPCSKFSNPTDFFSKLYSLSKYTNSCYHSEIDSY